MTRHAFCSFIVSFAAIVMVVGIGCGSTTTSATSTREDADASAPDAAPPSDDEQAASDVDAAPACTPDVTKVDVDEALVSTQPGTNGRVWIVRASSGETFLTLTVRESGGASSGPSTGSFGAEQRAPETAGVSLLVQTECSAHDDHFHCGPSFVPDGGSWSFTKLDTAVGGTVDGVLSADLVQVSIKGGVAKPVVNGKTLCIRSLKMSGVLVAP
jgi:hypothetical protein